MTEAPHQIMQHSTTQEAAAVRIGQTLLELASAGRIEEIKIRINGRIDDELHKNLRQLGIKEIEIITEGAI